jgi:hypothetical protein
MGKGNLGESCQEAIQSALEPGEVVTFSELLRRVKLKGSWKDESIWQDLMASIVNLPPARYHWKSSKSFLFIHGDGRYELYDPHKHPKTIS